MRPTRVRAPRSAQALSHAIKRALVDSARHEAERRPGDLDAMRKLVEMLRAAGLHAEAEAPCRCVGMLLMWGACGQAGSGRGAWGLAPRCFAKFPIDHIP